MLHQRRQRHPNFLARRLSQTRPRRFQRLRYLAQRAPHVLPDRFTQAGADSLELLHETVQGLAYLGGDGGAKPFPGLSDLPYQGVDAGHELVAYRVVDTRLDVSDLLDESAQG